MFQKVLASTGYTRIHCNWSAFIGELIARVHHSTFNLFEEQRYKFYQNKLVVIFLQYHKETIQLNLASWLQMPKTLLLTQQCKCCRLLSHLLVLSPFTRPVLAEVKRQKFSSRQARSQF